MSKNKSKKNKISPDFDSLLTNGPASYDSAVGNWWDERSLDKAHLDAYEHIASNAAEFYQKNKLDAPEFILDYACGNGVFIRSLLKYFPDSTIIGLDGASTLLENVKSNLPDNISVSEVSTKNAFAQEGSRVRLVCCFLPEFGFAEAQKADLSFLVFPNLISDSDDVEVFNAHGYCHDGDAEVGRMLARFREMDPEDEVSQDDPEDLYDELMTARVFSRNVYKLTQKGGHFVRVDYTNCEREELSMLTQWRSAFAECALEEKIKDKDSRVMFTLKNSSYRKSEVILDVFHQTGDPTDAEGGYSINTFKRV